MFDSLSEKLTHTLRGITGKARLTEENVSAALRDVRMALLEADVALPVVKDFIDHVKTRALGQVVDTSLNPGEAFVKIVHDELIRVMGEANDALNLNTKPPAIVLMAGLQGAGKTTTVAKLARFLKERHRKKVAVVSADVYRPAAIDQLETLAGEVGAYFVESHGGERPLDIAQRAVKEANTQFADVLIVDTAGRLAIDEEMMAEIRALQQQLQPVETLFVVDAMTGQDAANTAKAFNDALDAHRRRAGEGRWRRPRRCGAVGAHHHRQAHQVHRYGREDRRPRAVLSGPAGVAHPRHGRRAVADRGSGAQGRQEEGREARP